MGCYFMGIGIQFFAYTVNCEDALEKGACCEPPPIIYSLDLISLPTSVHLLITFANRLDPDQAQQNIGPDLDPICLTLRWYS